MKGTKLFKRMSAWILLLCMILNLVPAGTITAGAVTAGEAMAGTAAKVNQENIPDEKTGDKGQIVQKTENATIYQMESGKRKAEVYAGKVRFKNKKGDYVDYDNSLVENTDTETSIGSDVADYAYRTKKSDHVTFYPEQWNAENPIITTSGDYEVQLVPEKKIKTGKKVSRETADLYDHSKKAALAMDYATMNGEQTYQYESSNEGLKETVVLQNSDSSQISMSVKFANCYLITKKQLDNKKFKASKKIHSKPGENLYIYDGVKKELVGYIPYAYMLDAVGAYSEDCEYSVSLITDKEGVYNYQIQINLSEKYLKDAERKYPVSVDPTFVWDHSNAERTETAYVCSTAPSKRYTKENTRIMCVGKRDTSSDVCRSYISFGGINAILEDNYLDQATLTLNVQQTSSNANIYVRQVTSSWLSTLSYSNQPVKDKEYVGKKTLASGGKVEIPLFTDEMDTRVREDKTLYGFELTDSPDDSNTSSSKSTWIYNEAAVNGESLPKLTVVYYDPDSLTDIPHISYQVYQNNEVWSDVAKDGAESGSMSASKGARAIKFNVDANGYNIGSVKYRVYQGERWSSWVSSGSTAGNVNDTGKIKAIEMKALNSDGTVSSYYNIYYRAYVPGRGWRGWTSNEKKAGDFTSSGCISAIQAMLVPKVKYSLQYRDPATGELGTTNDIDEAYYGIACRDKKQIYSIGAKFIDTKMSSKHFIQTNASFENGTQSSVKSSTTSATNMCGTNSGNRIVDYDMQFYDVNMRAHYDFEHIATSSADEGREGKWRKNKRREENNTALGAVSVQVVPKGYQQGQKPCISDDFVPEVDGYAFVNSRSKFAYPTNYKIPKDKYVTLLGTTIGEFYYDIAGKWRGSCFGMSTSSVLFKMNKWDFKALKSESDEGAESVFGLTFPRGKKTNKLTDLIEYSQMMGSMRNVIQWGEMYDKTQENNKKIIEVLENAKKDGKHYVMYVCGSEAHAVVPIGVEKDSAGNYIIELYDCNNPEKISTAQISSDFSSFSYESYTWAALYDIDWMYSNYEGYFNTIWENVTQGKKNELQGMKDVRIIRVESEDVAVTNQDGEKIDDMPGVVKTRSIENPSIISYRVPTGDYVISTKSGPGNVTVVNYDSSIEYDGGEGKVINVSFTDDRLIKSSLSFLDKKEHKVRVKTYDKNKNSMNKTFAGKVINVIGQVEKCKGKVVK